VLRINYAATRKFSFFKDAPASYRAVGWVDYFENRELIEIGVSGANLPDAVFAQRNGDVRAVPWSRATTAEPHLNRKNQSKAPLRRQVPPQLVRISCRL
jgi:hypothetical protein